MMFVVRTQITINYFLFVSWLTFKLIFKTNNVQRTQYLAFKKCSGSNETYISFLREQQKKYHKHTTVWDGIYRGKTYLKKYLKLSGGLICFLMARWVTALSKWVVTFTLRFCCGGTGAGSGGRGRALLAAAARRTSSSCLWICCWIRTSSPSRPCWGTSQCETGRSSNSERTTGQRAG